jgi:hypothetical protein
LLGRGTRSSRPTSLCWPLLSLLRLSLRRQQRRGSLEPPAAPYLTAALGDPQSIRAGRTWDQAAHRIEIYRLEHGITGPRIALGPAPTGPSGERTGSEYGETSSGLSERRAAPSLAAWTQL